MKNKAIGLLNFFIKYCNSLSILRKFLIPSILGFIVFSLFFVYILSSTSYMKKNIEKINTQSIPLYEIIFDNEFLLQKISFELQSAVNVSELDIIKDSEIYAKKFRENLKAIEKSDLKSELLNLEEAFNNYYIEASNLSKDMIISKNNYENIHIKTSIVVEKYNKLLEILRDLRKKAKEAIENNVTTVYTASSEILLDSNYAFILWIFLSSLVLFYIYKDISSRINQIVKESESIASGKANFHKRLSSISSDELGLVINSINIFISKLEKNHHELEDVRDDIQRFIADTVHQIRTPLSSILMNAEMIREQTDDSLNMFVDSIDASVSMLSNSYEDLAYITSYDSIEYKPTFICLSDLLQSRIDFFGTICRMNLKEINSNIVEDVDIYINTLECERIIDNNISNAIKYANIEKPISINLSYLEDTNKIILEFRSYAKEIQNKNKIFEKNYREEDSKKGLGLGLNIVKNICDKYDIIYVVSYKDNQNIFTYIFEEI